MMELIKKIENRRSATGLKQAAAFLDTVIGLRGDRPFIPKGYYRFKTFQEAQDWSIRMMARAGSTCSVERRAFASGSSIRPKSTAYSLRSASAFTLLELMIVIGIIAILAALLFPVILGTNAKVKEKQALAETRTILMAIKSYRQEYGKWPAQMQDAQDSTYITNNYCVIQPLLGTNWSEFNPKNKIFLNLQISSNRMDVWGNYLDPWLIPYVISMDEDGNNNLLITNQASYSATNAGQVICTNLCLTNYSMVANVDVGVASFGGTSNALPWNTWTEVQ